MIDAFGIERQDLVLKREQPKSKKGRDASGAAIAGSGGAVAATGAVGGGIPGYRSKHETIRNIRRGDWKQRVGAAASTMRGGVFGYRTDAHSSTLGEFARERAKHADSVISRKDSFLRGRGTGKIGPEVDVIRHLKRGRAASNLALVGGTAATVYGVNRAKGDKPKKPISKSQRHTERYHGALLGAGGTAAALSIGGEQALKREGRKWAARRDASYARAQKIVPNMRPSISDDGVTRNPRVLAGKSKKAAEAAGVARGAAAQENYFSRVYMGTAKQAARLRNPALAATAVGGGGLLLARKRDKPAKKVSKSAFGVDAGGMT